MRRAASITAVLTALLVPLALATPSRAAGADAARLTAASLPPDAALEKEVEATPAQVKALGERFGAEIESVTQQLVVLGGLRAKVNLLACPTTETAARVEASLRAGKSGLLGRRGATVVEVSSGYPLLAKRLLAATGALPQAPAVYEARFRPACFDSLDYERANQVFNLLVGPETAGTEAQVRAIAAGWRAGRTLTLRTARRASFEAAFELWPRPSRSEPAGDVTRFALEAPPSLMGLPFAEVRARITVRCAFTPEVAPAPGAALVTATALWPSADPALRALAARLTAAAGDDLARLAALHAHVRSAISGDGPPGSRRPVAEALRIGAGRCWDRSDVLVTLCRASGIPAREVAGWVPALGAGHVWCEAYVAGGWLTADATTPWLGHTDDYVPWFATDDGEMPILYVGMPEVRRVE